MGELHVLSVGKGDLRITITPGDEESLAKARTTITAMLRRGYAIFVETGRVDAKGNPVLARVKAFRPKTLDYIIAEVVEEREKDAAPKRVVKDRAVPAGGAKATAVGRVAGG